MKKTTIFFLTYFFLLNVHAQSFDYTFSQSTAAYQPLSGTKTLVSSPRGLFDRIGNNFIIPIGFSFNFLGKAFDTVTVSNGYLFFGKEKSRAIATFAGMIPVIDTSGISSVVYSTASGILKIEYRKFGCGDSIPGNFTFQVWLYKQDNKVEFRTGPSTFLAKDKHVKTVVGLFDPAITNGVKGYFLTGNPSNAKAELTSGLEFQYLIKNPESDQVYTFIPKK